MSRQSARHDAIVTAVLLSRIQFGFVMSFHIIFPAFTIGLASWLAFLAGMYLKTKRTLWRELYLVLAEDFRGLVRARCRVRHRHEFSVRHELGAAVANAPAISSVPCLRMKC